MHWITMLIIAGLVVVFVLTTAWNNTHPNDRINDDNDDDD